MAKQYGIHKLGGKVDGQSYYYSKNGGFVSRKINIGMSNRVKTAKEYANTRLINAEFGAAGSLAGTIVSPVSQRWRFILNPIATGMLVKVIKAAMMQDTASAWGERVVPLAEMAGIQDYFNRLSKNQVPEEVKSGLQNSLQYTTSTNALMLGEAIQMTADTAQQLTDKGATHVTTKVFAFNVTKPVIGADGKTYEKPQSLMFDISDLFGIRHEEIAEDARIITDDALQNAPKVFNEESHLGGVLVVVLPERKVGNEYYTLQELCSAYWCPATEVQA